MIQKNTLLKVADNSGAKLALCIGLYKGKSSASVGDVISVSVQSVVSRGKVVKGKVYKAVIVRVKSGVRRADSSVMRFSSNAVVLINDQGEPLGSRVFGPIKSLPSGAFARIMSLAVEVLQ